MQPFATQCDLNLALWTARLAILKATGEASRRADSKMDDTPTKQETQTPQTKDDATPDDDEEDDPCPRYNGAFPLALPPAHFLGRHFSWTGTGTGTTTAGSSPASLHVPPTSRPPSSFGVARPQAPPVSATSSSGSSTSTTRRERATSTFSSEGEGEGEGEGDAVSEASFTAFSPSSRGSSTTSASPGVRDEPPHAENTHGHNGSEDGESEYGTAWNGSESGSGSGSGRGSALWGSARAGERMGFAEEAGLDEGSGGTAAIRAAARLAGLKPFGSLRHAPHRNSWSPAMREEWVAQMSAGVS
jgi:hypothetical protein